MPQRRGAPPISDPDVVYAADTYAFGVPWDCMARLRVKTPVVWAGTRAGHDPGCWLVLRHADAQHVLEHPDLFGPQLDEWLHGPADPLPRSSMSETPAGDGSVIDMEPAADALLDRVAGQQVADLAGALTRELPDMLRDALTGGLYALLRHPGQYALLRRAADPELIDRAVEEMLRWWSPVLHVRRTVQRKTVLGGVPVRPGEQVAVWLASADHDDEVFPDPERFELARTGAPHLAFGHGARRCLGATLARTHLRAVISALALRPGLLELAGEPERLRSNTRNSFTHLPIRFAPPTASLA